MSEWRHFSDIHIWQGSVATRLRRDGIFKHVFVANLLTSPPVKKFENRLIFGEVMGKSLVSCFFIDSRCSRGPVSVRMSVTSRCSIETAERIELVFLALWASFHPSYTVLKGNSVIFKNKNTSLWKLSQSPDLENLATAYRSSRRVINLTRERWTHRAW